MMKLWNVGKNCMPAICKNAYIQWATRIKPDLGEYD